MAINKETLQLDVLSNIDKVLKELNNSAEAIGKMSQGSVRLNTKFAEFQTSLKEINTILKQIGSGGIFDQLLGAQSKLNLVQKRTLEQYKAIEAAKNYSSKTDLKALKDEELKYTLKGQTQKLISAERLLIDENNKRNRNAVTLEQQKLEALNTEIQRRKELEAVAKKAQAMAEKANKPFMHDNSRDITRMRTKRNDPIYQEERMKLRLEETLGDGGAGLFKIQAGLLANYTLMNTFFTTLSFGKQFVLELDNSLKDLQAITATTQGSMEGLRQKLIEVSEGTKFTAVEVAGAAKILGQAGFSTQQIKDSIEGVTLLATATGSSLEEAADTATSVISVFNLRAEDMTHVSNVMTEAINKSKLSMDKLALGIQYAGNIAAESGLTFEETTAILGAMSNAGIKSGSTLGTGLRQVLIEMQNPTEKFKENLASVGLTIADVDVKSNGFVGVMRKLRDAGFDTTKAFESFEVRSAAAFAAIQNNPKLITELSEAFLYTNAAVEANEVQMKSLTNTISVMRGNFGLLINDLSGPITTTLRGFFNLLSEVITILREYPAVLALVGTGITTLTAAFTIGRIGLLLKNLTTGLVAAKTATMAFNAASAATGVGLTGLATKLFGALTPLGLLTIGLSLVVGATAAYYDINNKLGEGIEKTKSNIENLNGEYEKTGSNIATLSDNINRLTDRFVELKDNPEEVRLEAIKLQHQFAELGLELKNGASSSIYELIDALKDLRQEMNGTATDQLKATMAETAELFRQQALMAKQKIEGSNSNYDYYGVFTSGKSRNFVKQDPLFNQGKALRSETAIQTGSLNSSDLFNAQPGELTSIKNNLNDLYVKQAKFRGTLAKAINKLRVLGDKRTNDEDALLKAYVKSSELVTEDMINTKNLLSTAATIASDKMKEISQEIRSSGVSRAIDDRITEFKKNLSETEASINKGSDEDKEKAVKQIEDKIKTLRVEVLKMLAKALPNLSSKQLEEYFDINYGADVAAAETHAKDTANKIKEDLADSAKKSSDAFNTAMQMAKDGFDVIKESYDDIGRTFDARIKSYQDIIDANSNPYSGTYGQYSDAEIEALKKKQYQEQIGATKARLDALPNLISNLDGVIGKHVKGGIATDAKGNSIRSSVQGNKQLNDLIKQKNQLVAEQIALEAEYAAMLGRTTAEHMTFSEQIKATIDDYAKVQNAQSSWASNIRENLIGAFDSAKDGFADMVYGFVTGSQTAGDAVKSLAKSVLESMLKMATNKLATSLFGMAMGSLGNLFGGGKVIYDSPIGPTMPGSFNGLMAAGGLVRKAGGGAVSTRDSVPSLLRPGEYVLRNQAVDMIGRDNLDMINAMGARTISQSTANTQATAQNQNTQQVTNVWVISPDQKPGLTKADVIVTIADDINRGGPIKKLVKTVVSGG